MVFARAWAETRHDLSLENARQVVIRVVIWLIAVLAMYQFGWYEIAKDRVGEIVALILALFLLFPVVFIVNLFRAPYLIDKEKSSKISELENTLSGSNRNQKVAKLKEFYVESQEFDAAYWKFSPEMTLADIESKNREANNWFASLQDYVRDNFGDAALARLQNTSRGEVRYRSQIENKNKYLDVVENVARFRQNLAELIESDKWDD